VMVGVLHPGQMGSAIAAAARATGYDVVWCLADRSPATAERARAAGLRAVPTLAELLATSDVVLAICPPAESEELAAAVAATGFTGIYVEANAISVARSERIAALVSRAGARPVDAAIIGPPPVGGRSARLYLAGSAPDLAEVATIFTAGPVEAVQLQGGYGTASALKMAFASYQKTTRVLAGVAHALAVRHGVSAELLAEAARMPQGALTDLEYVPSVAARAWRWAPEMHEVADTLAAAGLPTELPLATAVTLHRWEADRDDWTLGVDAALARLVDGEQGGVLPRPGS
jgi:3-hydroxyisobutyrate dehydrogenase-like beta-hydroxyacid dehydrogenase